MSLNGKNERPTTRKGRKEYHEKKQASLNAEKKLIADMVQSNNTDIEIAAKLGISTSALKKRRQRYGIKRTERGRPSSMKRIHLDTSKITDKETREEVEGRIVSLKHTMEINRENRAKDKWGTSEKYYEQYDILYEQLKSQLYELENPTEEVYKIYMRGYQQRGRKPSDKYGEAEIYNIQCDRALKATLSWTWGKYKKWKEEHLEYMSTIQYYDYMFNDYLPSENKDIGFVFRPEKVSSEAKDTDYRNYDYK